MAMLTSVSGFPEWLPEDKLVEQALVDILREKFELYGFTPLETRSIEPLEQLLVKGETDQEIYVLRRLQADPDESDKNLGLHFDLTVPFARYVLENQGKLVFPFRRYQIQKSWRGETPQLGRFREFLQADFDIISDRELTTQSDAEIIGALAEILQSLPIPEVRLMVNNRKILTGFYLGLGIPNPQLVLRLVDKLDKVGVDGLRQQLIVEAGLQPEIAEKCLQLGQIKTRDPGELARRLKSLGVTHPLIDEGLNELVFLLQSLDSIPGRFLLADLSLVRGLDYYTGSVFEAKFAALPRYPSIAGGGRYDNLASTEGKGKFPGIGVTIGISRILGVVLHEGLLRASRKTPSCVLVALVSEEQRLNSTTIARGLRQRSIPCEIYERPDKFGKQIRYAEKKGIPFVWFPGAEGGTSGEVKDIRSGQQIPADAMSWQPPEQDRSIRIIMDEEAVKNLLKNPVYIGPGIKP